MATRRRVVAGGGGRRTVATKGGGGQCPLDDRPLSLRTSHSKKRLIVTLPYELCVVNAETLELEKTIELPSGHPTAFEAEEDGVLWLGGSHLHRGSLFSTAVSKIGTKLGGFVDRVCIVRPRLLCGAGSAGEVLWDTEAEDVVHRRKASEHAVLGLVPSPDGRAVWIDGSPHAWVIDPDHPQGYMKLKFKSTSPVDQESESISALGLSSTGRTLLAADDGGVAWTNRALRVVGERFPAEKPSRPIQIQADERWVYVLRRGNTLQRFLIEQPESEDGKEPADPLPDAQTVRLERATSAIAVLPGERLALAGPQADGQLGRVWTTSAGALAWEPLRLGKRKLIEDDAVEDGAANKRPDFTQVRSKLSGDPIAALGVDDVIAGPAPFWVTRSSGQALERPATLMDAGDVLDADAILMPAMFRLQEGTARPGLVLWPGAAKGRRTPETLLLTWGDEPREWLVLDTPSIRKQGWSRRGVFPIQVALRSAPPEVAGHRPRLPKKWADPELFDALAKECKKLLKVLW